MLISLPCTVAEGGDIVPVPVLRVLNGERHCRSSSLFAVCEDTRPFGDREPLGERHSGGGHLNLLGSTTGSCLALLGVLGDESYHVSPTVALRNVFTGGTGVRELRGLSSGAKEALSPTEAPKSAVVGLRRRSTRGEFAFPLGTPGRRTLCEAKRELATAAADVEWHRGL